MVTSVSWGSRDAHWLLMLSDGLAAVTAAHAAVVAAAAAVVVATIVLLVCLAGPSYATGVAIGAYICASNRTSTLLLVGAGSVCTLRDDCASVAGCARYC